MTEKQKFLKIWSLASMFAGLVLAIVGIVAACLGSTPLIKRIADRLTATLPGTVTELLRCCVVLLLLALCTLYLVNSTYHPFIYFRF